ncbi:MAG: oxidative damage protection protein [Gammaproteobacteria bacterium]|nr:oxidative damage protection protein [Gammaproteobacteria bacterium]
MTRQVHCAKLGIDAEGLDFPPLPGERGQRIFDSVSKQAWSEWLAHQTMLINEKHLSVRDPEHKAYLTEQMEKYLFGGDVDQPEGYVPKSDSN